MFVELEPTELAADGKVKRINLEKGIGCIQPDAAGPDVFVPVSSVTNLLGGQRGSYEAVNG
jgi:cold shock CspA family protein